MDSQPVRLRILQPAAFVLQLQGEVDLHTVDELEKRLAAIDPTSQTVLDLAEVSFMDSSGLRVMIEAHQQREGAGGQLVFSKPSEVVVKLLEITGLLDRLHVDQADEQ